MLMNINIYNVDDYYNGFNLLIKQHIADVALSVLYTAFSDEFLQGAFVIWENHVAYDNYIQDLGNKT